MPFKAKDFVEIEFTGKTKDGEVFDSNIKEDLQKLHEGHHHEIETAPFIFCLGEGMFLKAIDDFLIGKETGEYTVDLPAEKAFGNRSAELVQMIPLKLFKESQTYPAPGMVFNFDGRIAKILSVSSGRVIADFNNPLAGKEVVYKIKVIKKIEDINEKAKALIQFLFRKDFKFEIKEKNIILYVEKPLVEFIKLFEGKFSDLLDLKLEIKETEEKEEKEHVHEHSHEHEHQ